MSFNFPEGEPWCRVMPLDRDIGRSFWSRWTCSLATYVIIQAKTYCWGHLTCLSDTKVYSIVNQSSPRIFLSFFNLWTISCNCIRDLINRNTAHEYFPVYQMHCARTLENRNYLHHFQQTLDKAKACFQLTAGQLKAEPHHEMLHISGAPPPSLIDFPLKIILRM